MVGVAICLFVLGNTLFGEKLSDVSRSVFPASSSLVYGVVNIRDYGGFLNFMSPAKPTVEEKSFESVLAYDGDKIFGLCSVLNEIGKEMPITFIVCISEPGKLRVDYIDVLVYRETRGGEIRSKIFLNQFKGKSEQDQISVGKDIRNIRGATLSAWATTRVVRKTFALFKTLISGGADFKFIRQFSSQSEREKFIRRCFLVGDSYLCVGFKDKGESDLFLEELKSFSEKISRDFSDFYFFNKNTPYIRELISKYSRLSSELGFFNIWWRGDGKADLGGVWKGYVVDLIRDFFQKNNIKDYEISFGWSTFYFSQENPVDVFGKVINISGAISVSDTWSGYSVIFNPVEGNFVRERRRVAVIHQSAEFSDFASTLCAVWGEDCVKYVSQHGGKVIFIY
ncbi:hypothetical protein HRbin19_00268 [bacterium HR19]|nr:hypothetical protein HRbin19_00268 [bacterium HR19]